MMDNFYLCVEETFLTLQYLIRERGSGRWTHTLLTLQNVSPSDNSQQCVHQGGSHFCLFTPVSISPIGTG